MNPIIRRIVIASALLIGSINMAHAAPKAIDRHTDWHLEIGRDDISINVGHNYNRGHHYRPHGRYYQPRHSRYYRPHVPHPRHGYRPHGRR